jgi:tRNA pseudouridine55 synthase
VSERNSSVAKGNSALTAPSRPLHCVINLDKPQGITSHQAVETVRKRCGIRKAGHAGTLDPLATGVLLVCTGEATKITRFLSELDKEYVVVMKLGEETDTYDAEGTVVRRTEPGSVGRDDVEKVLPAFTGTIEQLPPMYSAVKVGGRPLYKLARKGLTVEREKRIVTVHEIGIIRFSLPFLEMRVSCSRGTYIRTLCHDIGELLGVGAHVTRLERTRIGGFRVADAVALDEVGYLFADEGRGAVAGLSDIDTALSHLREFRLSEADFRRAVNGLAVPCPDGLFLPDEYLRLKDLSGKLFAIGRAGLGAVKTERMLHL